MKSIILDTDPGVDDALAFLLAFNSPEINVEAVTTVAGNVDHTKAHINAKKLLEFLRVTDVPLCGGAIKPLIRTIGNAEEFHGKTGLGKAVLPVPKMETSPFNAVEIILRKAENLGKKLTLVAIGPLTNIASAILADPELPEKVNGLVIMGGAFYLTPYGHGNVNAVAEFNVWYDPEAAKIVFNSGIPITCASIDSTTNPDYKMSRCMFEKIREKKSEKAELVIDLCKDLMERFNAFSLHDPMAIAYLIDQSIFRTGKFKVDVETQGELTRGMTVVEHRRYLNRVNVTNAEIILDVDSKRFHNLLFERVT
jgi:inosine-uridine nucleoside N-ribohydrolase